MRGSRCIQGDHMALKVLEKIISGKSLKTRVGP